MSEKKDRVVYLHKRVTDKKVFYVGIGSKDRAFVLQGRSDWWHRVVMKYGYEVDIIAENLTSEEAGKMEVSLISKYGRRDLGEGYLVNLTDGADGTKRPSRESIEKRVEKTSKAISAYYPNGKLHKHFKSAVEAGNELGVLKHNITSAIRGDLVFAGDFIWCYKGEIPPENIKTWARMLDEKTDRITIFKAYTKDGEFVKEFFKLPDAAHYFRRTKGDKIKYVLDKSLNGDKRVLTFADHFFIYSKEATPKEIKCRVDEIKNFKRGSNLKHLSKEKKINMLDLNGNFIRSFNSLLEAKAFLNKGQGTSISKALTGVQTKAYGYKWEYAAENFFST